MLDAFIENLQSALTDWFGYPWIAVVILAMMPIVEARLAVPMAMACGYKAWQSFFIGFLGSSLPAPLLLLVLIPFIKWLAKTKLFRKLGETVYEKFQKKSETVDKNSSDFKKMLGLFVFVAIPLPLTGVWTGCAVASIIGLKYHKALCRWLPQRRRVRDTLGAVLLLAAERHKHYNSGRCGYCGRRRAGSSFQGVFQKEERTRGRCGK